MESVFAKTKEKMDKCLTSLERDFAAIRAGRANPAVLDKVMVDYYGVPTPINQMVRRKRTGSKASCCSTVGCINT